MPSTFPNVCAACGKAEDEHPGGLCLYGPTPFEQARCTQCYHALDTDSIHPDIRLFICRLCVCQNHEQFSEGGTALRW